VFFDIIFYSWEHLFFNILELLTGKIRELRRRLDANRIECLVNGTGNSLFFNNTEYPYCSLFAH